MAIRLHVFTVRYWVCPQDVVGQHGLVDGSWP